MIATWEGTGEAAGSAIEKAVELEVERWALRLFSLKILVSFTGRDWGADELPIWRGLGGDKRASLGGSRRPVHLAGRSPN